MDEGGHWYTREGKPMYQIEKKGGGFRPVNLAWDRKLNPIPSVTTILQVVAKPQLNKWKENQMMLAALTLGKEPDEPDDVFCKRIREDAFRQVDVAAAKGTAIHDAVEQYFKGEVIPGEYVDDVAGILGEIERIYPEIDDWVAEKSFAHPIGFGGRVDLHSPSTGVVVDFKGKDGDFSDGKRLAYDQHWQLGAYQVGLNLSAPAECANIFFSRTHPGKAYGHKWNVGEVVEGWRIFNSALGLWKLLKKYDPSFYR